MWDSRNPNPRKSLIILRRVKSTIKINLSLSGTWFWTKLVVRTRYQLKGSKKEQSHKLKGMAFYYRFTGVPTWIWPSPKTKTKIWDPTIMCLIYKLFYLLLYSTFISKSLAGKINKKVYSLFFFERGILNITSYSPVLNIDNLCWSIIPHQLKKGS